MPGDRRGNLAEFLWAFVHPAVYRDGDPAARMLGVAVDAYGWRSDGLVDAMIVAIEGFLDVVRGDPGATAWGAGELAYAVRNADLFRARLRP